MFSGEDLKAYFTRLAFPATTQELIHKIRASEPVRRVKGRVGNVTTRYISLKMPFVIQAESHKVELRGIYDMDADPEVIEYYDQPDSIKLLYLTKSDKPVGILHTPDFFVLKKTGAGWEEWKTEKEMTSLCEEMPNRYVSDDKGGWRCPPGEEHAQPLGLYYRVRTDASVNPMVNRNLQIMEDFYRHDVYQPSYAVEQMILKLVQEKPGITIDELLEVLNG